MFFLKVFVFTCIILLTFIPIRESTPSQRIVNGLKAAEKQFPYIISLADSQGQHTCTGSLIYEWLILTAAHCYNLKYGMAGGTKLDLNTTNTQIRFVVNVTRHPRYVPKNNFYSYCDLALAFVDNPYEITDYVTKIDLYDTYVKAGTVLTNAGWGNLDTNPQSPSSNDLMYQNLTILSMFDCPIKFYSKQLICASSKHSQLSFGDSGGPLVHDGKLYAVASAQTMEGVSLGYFANAVTAKVWILSNGTIGGSSSKYMCKKILLQVVALSPVVKILNFLFT